MWSEESKNAGVRRHRLITGTCTMLSLTVLSVFLFDAKSAFTRSAIIDRNYNLSYDVPKEVPELPSGMYAADMSSVNDHRRAVYQYTGDSPKYGYVDDNGKIVIKPKWSEAAEFSEGIARVKEWVTPTGDSSVKDSAAQNDASDSHSSGEAVYRYIDSTGKVIITGPFKCATSFHNGVAAIVTQANRAALINKTGKIIATTKSQTLPEQIGDLWKFDVKGREGLMNSKGDWVIEPDYATISNFDGTPGNTIPLTSVIPMIGQSTGYILVYKDGQKGLLDSKGKSIVPLKYEEIDSFNKDGIVYADKDLDTRGLIKSNGDVVLDAKYDYISPYDDVIAAKDHKAWHLFTSQGKEINTKIDAPLTNETLPWFQDGMGLFALNNKVGFLDTAGNIKIPAKFDYAMPFENGHAAVFSDGVWRFIDKSGQFTSKTEFATIGKTIGENQKVEVAGPLYRAAEGRAIDHAKESFKNLIKDYQRIYKGR